MQTLLRSRRASVMAKTVAAAAIFMVAQVVTASAASATTIPSAITAYFNASDDNTENVVYVDNNGALWDLTCNSYGCWTANQLTNPGEYYVADGQLLGYTDNNGNGRLFFLSEAGGSYVDMSELKGNPPTSYFNITSYTDGYHPSGAWASDEYVRENGSYADSVVAADFTGYQDTNSNGPAHHVFFISVNGNDIQEVWGNDANNNWGEDQVGALDLEDSSGLTSAWDNSNQNIYANSGGRLVHAYYNDGWQHQTLLGSGYVEPGPELAAFGFSGTNDWLWGVYQYDDTPYDNYLASYQWNSSSGWANSVTEWYNSVDTNPGCQLAYWWNDSTSNYYFPTGFDGGCFYIASDGGVWMTSPGVGNRELNGAFPKASVHSAPRPISGFYDGYNIHAFWIGVDGYVYEAYAEASTLSNSSQGNWVTHTIGGGGNAAH
jgi:hypothetical protein